MKSIQSRIIEVEYPGGQKIYIGQLNYKCFWGLFNRWVNVTSEWSDKSYAIERLKDKRSEWEYENNKKVINTEIIE